MKRRSIGMWLVGAACAFQALACVGGSKGLSSEDKDRLKPYILESAPADIPHKLDVNFENKIHLIGYKFDPEQAKPGTEVKITYWWRCDDTVDEGWSLFTHLHEDATDKSDNLDWVGPLRENRNNKQILGPDKWEKGKVYVDEQTYKMPEGTKGPDLTVMVGIWKGDARLRVITGPNDGDNRAIVGKIRTGLTAQEPQHTQNDIPSLSATKLAANEKIVIDGKGDDKAWGAAASTPPFVDVGTGRPNAAFPVNGSAKVTWDDTNLYVLFDVKEEDVVGAFTKKDEASQKDMWTTTGQPKLWMKDTVEIMVDPDGDGDNKDYYEIQINPQNKQFHTQYDGYNIPKTDPNGPFGHEDWAANIKSAVSVSGTIDKSGDKDTGYSVEAAIPWASFTKAAHHPPQNGDAWRFNFYAMKNNGGVAWSPILGQGNFHRATRFGKIAFVVPGAPPPVASGVASGAPPSEIVADGGAVALPRRRPMLVPPKP